MEVNNKDSNGILLSAGNRKHRRFLAAGTKTRSKTKKKTVGWSKKVKLPKEMWEKGKSKFLHARLNLEK